MDIHEYAKARKATKDFLLWIEEEPQIMLDWRLDSDGTEVGARYNYLSEVYDAEMQLKEDNEEYTKMIMAGIR